jgi:hypothetical protein
MSDKFTIINLLNKLAVEQKLTWKIKSAYGNGLGKNLLEVLIYSLPQQIRKGQIIFEAGTGQVMTIQYSGFKAPAAENIVDMLLDVINFEKHRKAADGDLKKAVSAY